MLPYVQITVPTGKIFDRLVCLELRTHEREWWNLLSIMLDSSPKLQILKLADVSNFISQLSFFCFTFKYFVNLDDINCIVFSAICG